MAELSIATGIADWFWSGIVFLKTIPEEFSFISINDRTAVLNNAEQKEKNGFVYWERNTLPCVPNVCLIAQVQILLYR